MPPQAPGGVVVLVGDRLDYLGLLPAVAAGLLGLGWKYLTAAGVVFPIGAAVLVVGGGLKRRAYVLAGRDGIPTRH